jgi:hypothetical protein
VICMGKTIVAPLPVTTKDVRIVRRIQGGSFHAPLLPPFHGVGVDLSIPIVQTSDGFLFIAQIDNQVSSELAQQHPHGHQPILALFRDTKDVTVRT